MAVWALFIFAAVTAWLLPPPEAGAAERLCTPLPCKHTATALPAAADGRRCFLFSVTNGGQTKEEAVAQTQQAMREMVPRWGRLNRLNFRRITIRAMQVDPYPYWRTKVTPDLYVKPDVVTKEAHITCWEGITLPVACTAGAKICG